MRNKMPLRSHMARTPFEIPWRSCLLDAEVPRDVWHTPRCGVYLGCGSSGVAGAHKASDGTHLAGELHATHPGEAHDGGSRGVESEGV